MIPENEISISAMLNASFACLAFMQTRIKAESYLYNKSHLYDPPECHATLQNLFQRIHQYFKEDSADAEGV